MIRGLKAQITVNNVYFKGLSLPAKAQLTVLVLVNPQFISKWKSYEILGIICPLKVFCWVASYKSSVNNSWFTDPAYGQ